jgi:hypothetical protein
VVRPHADGRPADSKVHRPAWGAVPRPLERHTRWSARRVSLRHIPSALLVPLPAVRTPPEVLRRRPAPTATPRRVGPGAVLRLACDVDRQAVTRTYRWWSPPRVRTAASFVGPSISGGLSVGIGVSSPRDLGRAPQWQQRQQVPHNSATSSRPSAEQAQVLVIRMGPGAFLAPGTQCLTRACLLADDPSASPAARQAPIPRPTGLRLVARALASRLLICTQYRLGPRALTARLCSPSAPRALS